MPIQVCCPQGHKLAVADRYAGQRVKCPKCQSALAVPALAGSGVPATSVPSAKSVPLANGQAAVPKPPPIPKPPIAPPPSVAAAPPVPVAATVPMPVANPNVSPPSFRTQSADGVSGYRPEPSRVHTVYLLTAGMVLMTCFQLAPAFSQFNPAAAPNWVRWLLMLAIVQLAYAVWMVSFPDWSTVRSAMLVLAAVATIYGVALGIATVTPRDKPMPFDLDDVRDKVRLWCGAILLLLGLLTYACGRIAFRWRKAYWAMTAPAA